MSPFLCDADRACVPDGERGRMRGEPDAGEPPEDLVMNPFCRDRRLAHVLLAAIAVGVVAACTAVVAQDEPASNMEILVQKLKADKKLLIAANLGLTEAESKQFWPVYDQYQAELASLNERLADTIDRYAEAYTAMTLTDDEATSLMKDALAVEEAEVAMKKKYFEKLSGMIPAMKAARYIQMENKIRAVIRYDLAAEIPLAE